MENSKEDTNTKEKKKKIKNTAREVSIYFILYILFNFIIFLKVKNVRLFVLLLVTSSVALILRVCYIFIMNSNIFNNIIFIKDISNKNQNILTSMDRDKKTIEEEMKKNIDLSKQLEAMEQNLISNNKALKLFYEKTNKLNDINQFLKNTLINSISRSNNINKNNGKISSIVSDLLGKIKGFIKFRKENQNQINKLRSEGKIKGGIGDNFIKRFARNLSGFLRSRNRSIAIGTNSSREIGRNNNSNSKNISEKNELFSSNNETKNKEEKINSKGEITSNELNEVNNNNMNNKQNNIVNGANNNIDSKNINEPQHSITNEQSRYISNEQRNQNFIEKDSNTNRIENTNNINNQNRIINNNQLHQELKNGMDTDTQELMHLLEGRVVDINGDGTVAGIPKEFAETIANAINGVESLDKEIESQNLEEFLTKNPKSNFKLNNDDTKLTKTDNNEKSHVENIKEKTMSNNIERGRAGGLSI